MPLQLNAVHEINRHRHVLFSQGVEEWILQQLPFVAHGCSVFLFVQAIVMTFDGGERPDHWQLRM
jgi:hypothetical protein